MKLVVAGSRDITDRGTVGEAIRSSPYLWPPKDGIIHGGAEGVDSIVEEICQIDGVETEVYEPDWDSYGKSAGPLRNDEMAQAGDTLLAIWDGHSRGTRDMIDKALNHGLETYVYVVE